MVRRHMNGKIDIDRHTIYNILERWIDRQIYNKTDRKMDI